MFLGIPLLKFPNLLSGVPKSVDYGTDSPLDDVDGFETHLAWDDLTGKWETYVACPSEAWELAPLTVFDEDIFVDDADAWGSLREAWNVPQDEWINLEVTHFPTGDELSVHFPYGTINLGKLSSEATVSWWVEPRIPHTVSWFVEPWKPHITSHSRHKGTLEVPLDGKSHFIAVCFENGVATKAYLDSDVVWISDVKLDKETTQFQWGYTW